MSGNTLPNDPTPIVQGPKPVNIVNGRVFLDGKEVTKDVTSMADLLRGGHPEPLGARGSVELQRIDRSFVVAPEAEPTATQVNVSRSRPSFPCSCGKQLGPNEGRQVFRANVRQVRGPTSLTLEPAYSGRHVYAFTCPNCGEGHIVESAHVLQVAVPPVGEARNEPCPCASGKKAKRCHPGGYVALG